MSGGKDHGGCFFVLEVIEALAVLHCLKFSMRFPGEISSCTSSVEIVMLLFSLTMCK